MPEIPHFLDYVDPSLVWEVHQKLAVPYSSGLDLPKIEIRQHTVKRWGENNPHYGDISFFAKRPGFSESVLEHAADMLVLYEDLLRKPVVRKEFSIGSVTYMTIFHDCAEYTGGDAPCTGPTRESEHWTKMKEHEREEGIIFIAEIPDPSVREEMESYYRRYLKHAANDKEVLLTCFLDKLQGTTRTGVDNVFDYQAIGLEKPHHKLVDHIRDTLAIVNNSAISLIRAVSPEVQQVIFDYTFVGIDRFKQIGFKGVAEQAQANLSWAMGH